jgi:hypothetical protein
MDVTTAACPVGSCEFCNCVPAELNEVCWIENVDPDASEVIATSDDRSITYRFGKLNTVVPANAATIHKS